MLYTYLNVPFLELKRQSLLQQAQIAAETLEREYRELEGFIGGHSYGNYMQHLQSSDVDPTAGADSVRCCDATEVGWVDGWMDGEVVSYCLRWVDLFVRPCFSSYV